MAHSKPKAAPDPGALIFGDFAHAVDAFFDEILVDRWKCGAASQFERSEFSELPDRYEIRLASRGLDPATIEVETRGQRLTVRATADERGRLESTFTFSEYVEHEAASAAWSMGVLTVVVPKHKARKIRLKAD
ncbi:MAG TPA: Hsp20/alpha crystallin family protein [Candidatus Binataceae bacterium]|nr:Hsp20/alpha crystallin family protein [Candidatus Binataceae bacterium]